MEQRYRAPQRPLPSLARLGRSRSVDGLRPYALSPDRVLAEHPRVESQPIQPVTPKPVGSSFDVWIDAKPLRAVQEVEAESFLPALGFSLDSALSVSALPLPLASVGSLKLGMGRRFKIGATHVLYVLAAIVFVVGVYVAADGWRVNHQVAAQVGGLSSAQTDAPGGEPGSEQSATAPAAASASQPQTCRASANGPSAISAKSISMRACVVSVGIDAQNKLESPKSIFTAGWYKGGAKPTDAQGAIVIDGHAGRLEDAGVGAFSGIHRLKPGNEIQIEYGDGSKATFVVRDAKTVKTSEVNMGEVLRSIDSEKLGLNLITCAGNYDDSSHEFDSRTVVFAVQK